MASFKKNSYTLPVISNHKNDLEKDWYVSFRFKHKGRIHKFKRREGVNRIKNLEERLAAVQDLQQELAFDLRNGWNPFIDKKRELSYNPFHNPRPQREDGSKPKRIAKKEEHERLVQQLYNKGLDLV